MKKYIYSGWQKNFITCEKMKKNANNALCKGHIVRTKWSVGATRTVTDNAKINLSTFKPFRKRMLLPSIPHLCDSNRKILFSFDPNHIIINTWSLFLENNMIDGKELMSGKFLKSSKRGQHKSCKKSDI